MGTPDRKHTDFGHVENKDTHGLKETQHSAVKKVFFRWHCVARGAASASARKDQTPSRRASRGSLPALALQPVVVVQPVGVDQGGMAEAIAGQRP
jgi:hypothetical protein